MNPPIIVQPSLGIPAGPLPSKVARRKPVAAVIRPMPRETGKEGTLRLDEAETRGPAAPYSRKFELGDYVKWLKDKIEADRLDARQPTNELGAEAAKLTKVAAETKVVAPIKTPLPDPILESNIDTLFSTITDTDLVQVMEASPVDVTLPKGVRFEELPAVGFATDRFDRIDDPHDYISSVPESHVAFTEPEHEDEVKVSAKDTDAFIEAVSKAIASVLTDRAEPELEQKVRDHFETELYARSVQALAQPKENEVVDEEAVEKEPIQDEVALEKVGPEEVQEDEIDLEAIAEVAAIEAALQAPQSAMDLVDESEPVVGLTTEDAEEVASQIISDSSNEIPTEVAAWDVEDFRWPEVTNQMIVSGAGAIDSLAQSTFSMLSNDHQRLAITGLGREAGTSSIAITLARWVAALGKNVLLVDADIAKPNLSSQVGLAPNLSWINAVSQSLPAAEVIVRSQKSNLCIMPLAQLVSRTTWPRFVYDSLGDLIEEVRDHFDLVIVDAGPSSQLLAELSRPRHLVDATLMVHDGVNSPEFRRAKSMLEGFGLSKFIMAKNRAVRQSANVA